MFHINFIVSICYNAATMTKDCTDTAKEFEMKLFTYLDSWKLFPIRPMSLLKVDSFSKSIVDGKRNQLFNDNQKWKPTDRNDTAMRMDKPDSDNEPRLSFPCVDIFSPLYRL